MPYITQERRKELSDLDVPGYGGVANNPGELNYIITTLILDYLFGKTKAENNYSYKDLNEVIGVLECVKLELYRRVVTPYEEDKCMENGDVY